MKKETITVAIVGSRQRRDRYNVDALVDSLPSDVRVISGGCCGVDTWAIGRARERGLQTRVFLPDLRNLSDEWEHIRRFYARNQKIAQYADVIYAFVAPSRKGGTENTIKWANKFNKPVFIM